MAKLRLQKYLAQCGVASRRKSEELISAGKVSVNGRIVREQGTQIDPYHDRVLVAGKPVRQAHTGIILLHKPRGVVSTMKDPHGRPTVAEFLTGHFRSYYPVGRLDFESTGLIVMTNDGEIAARLLHPRYGFERVYRVVVEGSVASPVTRKIAQGVKLEDGVVKARVAVLGGGANETELEVKIWEGRNRIVRRLMDHFGHPVVSLQRIAHGPFRLGKLKAGEIKKLSEHDYQWFRRKILASESGVPGGRDLT